jgi:hypothetical protein
MEPYRGREYPVGSIRWPQVACIVLGRRRFETHQLNYCILFVCALYCAHTMPKDETPEEVRRWFLSTVQEMWPVAEGSLSLRKSPCVRKNCQACAKGEGHQSYVLYCRSEGRRSSVYVPDALAQQVQTAIDNGRELQQLMSEAGVRYVNALKTARRKP